jgi:hypothetical protein
MSWIRGCPCGVLLQPFLFFVIIAFLECTPAFAEPLQRTSEEETGEEIFRNPAGSKEAEKERERLLLRWLDPLPAITDFSKLPTFELEKTGDAKVSETPPGKKEERKGEFLIAPIPVCNPTVGSGFALVSGYIYPWDKDDKVSPPSFTGAGGVYTDSRSWALAVAQKAYLNEDRWRILGGVGIGQVNYSFYGIGTAAASTGKSIPLTQKAGGFLVETLRRIGGDFFAGLKYQFGKVKTLIDLDDRNTDIGLQIPDATTDMQTAVLGLHIQRDTRDSTFYPRKGSLLDLEVSPYSEIWGGDFSYQAYSIAYNKYISLDNRQVLAFRGYSRFTAGDVPFFDLCLFGMGSDLRGYTGGQYRDRMMLAAQAEYRLELPRKFGVVAFAGIGEVFRTLNDLNTKDLLPSAGAGIRYTIAAKNHINLRLDFAWGKGSNGLYFSVGEAF